MFRFYRSPPLEKIKELELKCIGGHITKDVASRKLLLRRRKYRFYTKYKKDRPTYTKFASIDDRLDPFRYLAFIKFGYEEQRGRLQRYKVWTYNKGRSRFASAQI